MKLSEFSEAFMAVGGGMKDPEVEFLLGDERLTVAKMEGRCEFENLLVSRGDLRVIDDPDEIIELTLEPKHVQDIRAEEAGSERPEVAKKNVVSVVLPCSGLQVLAHPDWHDPTVLRPY